MSINRVTITGNIGNDPELRGTSGGTSVLRFNVAVNDRVPDGNGNWVDRPNWVTCIVFGNRADALSRILAKGAKVAVEGKLRYSQWERDGQKRSKVEVAVDEVELMQRERQGGYGQQRQAQPELYDESIPF